MSTESKKIGSVLVLGGGIAGIQSALDLADSGFLVHLVESRPSIGGNMAKLDKTFPTNDCATCMFSPKMLEVVNHPNVEIYPLTTLEGVEGTAGNFQVTLTQHPRYIRVDRCTSCGICAEKCPKKVIDEFNEELSFRKAAYIPYPQSAPRAYVIDPINCIYLLKGKCGACKKFCPANAVDFDQRPVQISLQVGSILLATGYELSLDKSNNIMGFGRYRNVVSSLQFERMLSATGPYEGHIRRPSDGKTPHSIAWIQCVLSRNMALGKPYCSSVCCMYAVKQAMLTKIHEPNIHTTIYFMDIRAQGKGFDQFVERGRDQFGIEFQRTMMSEVHLNPQNENLIIETLSPDGETKEEREVELVVLSSGVSPSRELIRLSQKLGIDLDPYGFVAAQPFDLVSTSRPGIYVCGMGQAPKDIPDTVIQSGAAAAKAATLLADKRGTESKEKIQVLEKALQENGRVGVFICHCGSNIAGVLDIEALKNFVAGLKGVTVVQDFLFTCATDTTEKLKEIIEKNNLNRVVVAACSPRTHEPVFREVLKSVGLNPYLFEMANIRDQCSWVHSHNRDMALNKAKELIAGAVERAKRLEPLYEHRFKVNKQALVLGGGIAGMTCALTMADQGFKVYLVEKGDKLGGLAGRIYETLEGSSPKELVSSLKKRIENNPLIEVFLNSQLVEHSGHVGKFEGTVLSKERSVRLEYGVVVVATGCTPYNPSEYLYGQDPRVLTQMEFQRRLWEEPDFAKGIQSVAMIQCIGSRNEEFPSCSRVCCSTAVKNALRLKELNPHSQALILYRDMRTFGLKELAYYNARSKGILFFQFDPSSPPTLSSSGEGLKLEFSDPRAKVSYSFNPDILVLSEGIRSNPLSNDIANLLKLPRDRDGFFQEAHVKLRPVEFYTSGYYLAGTSHSPRFTDETIAMAQAAAQHAIKVLCKDELSTPATVAVVNSKACASCLICVRSCPVGAPIMNEKGRSEIRPSLCMGCGICASECPAKAINLLNWKDEQIHSQLKGILAHELP